MHLIDQACLTGQVPRTQKEVDSRNDIICFRPIATLRLLRYDNKVSDIYKGIFGAGAHTDYGDVNTRTRVMELITEYSILTAGLLTLLSTDNNPGLEIYYNDEWISVPVKEDCFIVNIGDLGGTDYITLS